MSLRNRARALQKKTGLSYQQALQRVRALGERPAKLRRETGWPLEVCDRFLVDGHAPIKVIEARGGAAPEGRCRVDQMQMVCETLCTMASARAVLLIDLRGRVIAHVNPIAPGTPLIHIRSWPGVVERILEKGQIRSNDTWELDAIRVLVSAAVKKRAVLIVAFQRDETSLGLVRLRMAKTIEELERLLPDEETPGMPPIGSGGGPSGIPSELRVKEPVPEERPKPKPTPIGRKRKRDR